MSSSGYVYILAEIVSISDIIKINDAEKNLSIWL
jgi:hypothetical protein